MARQPRPVAALEFLPQGYPRASLGPSWPFFIGEVLAVAPAKALPQVRVHQAPPRAGPSLPTR
jgi:hypothetical protein